MNVIYRRGDGTIVSHGPRPPKLPPVERFSVSGLTPEQREIRDRPLRLDTLADIRRWCELDN